MAKLPVQSDVWGLFFWWWFVFFYFIFSCKILGANSLLSLSCGTGNNFMEFFHSSAWSQEGFSHLLNTSKCTVVGQGLVPGGTAGLWSALDGGGWRCSQPGRLNLKILKIQILNLSETATFEMSGFYRAWLGVSSPGVHLRVPEGARWWHPIEPWNVLGHKGPQGPTQSSPCHG